MSPLQNERQKHTGHKQNQVFDALNKFFDPVIRQPRQARAGLVVTPGPGCSESQMSPLQNERQKHTGHKQNQVFDALNKFFDPVI